MELTENIVLSISSYEDMEMQSVISEKSNRKSSRISEHETMELESVVTDHSHSRLSTDNTPVEKERHHFPVFIIGVSLVQIITFYYFDFYALGFKLAYDPYRRHEIWRFFTPILLHVNSSHLWGNVAMQLILGVFLEVVHEWKRIAVIYSASVFGGSLCTTVLRNNSYGVGASGAVSGLLFSHLSTVILNWNAMEYKFSRLFCVSVFIIYDVGSTCYRELYLGVKLNIGHAAHFGGAVTGFLVAILVLKNFKQRPWKEVLQKICIGILLAIFVIVLVMNVTLTDYFPPNEWNFDYEKTYYNRGNYHKENTTQETSNYFDYDYESDEDY